MKNATLLSATLLLPVLCLAQVYPTGNSSSTTAPARKMNVTSFGTNNTPMAKPYTTRLQPSSEQQANTNGTTEMAMTARTGHSYMNGHSGYSRHNLHTKPLYVQDNGVRDNRAVSYTSPSGVAKRNNYINPGNGYVLARYNPTFNRYFYYCTSPYSRSKCSDSARQALAAQQAAFIKRRLRADLGNYGPFCHCSSAFYPFGYPVCPTHMAMAMQLAPDNTSKHSNSGQFFSFDGYVVYSKDTLYGIITITGNAVSIEYKTIRNDKRNICYDIKDGKLGAITLFKGPRTLNLVRLEPTDKHLHRVIHAGRLNVYDRSYSFLNTENIGKRLTIVNSTGTTIKTKDELELAMEMNDAYGLQLKKGHSTAHLVRVLNQLD